MPRGNRRPGKKLISLLAKTASPSTCKRLEQEFRGKTWCSFSTPCIFGNTAFRTWSHASESSLYNLFLFRQLGQPPDHLLPSTSGAGGAGTQPPGEGQGRGRGSKCCRHQRLLGGPQVLHKPPDISRQIYPGRPKGVWKQYTTHFLKPHATS